MKRHLLFGLGLAFVTVLSFGCTKSNPLTPTATATGGSGPDGSMLKVSAPTLVSPVTGQQLNTRQPTLVLQSSAGQFVAPQVSYELQVTTVSGAVVYARTIAGGAANGQGTVSHAVEVALDANQPFRWRARAVTGADASPWSNSATGSAMFLTTPAPVLNASSSVDDFKNYFFALIAQKSLGNIASAAALSSMEPELTAVGIILEKNSAGQVRGRLYLPTGNPNSKFTRAVDIGDFGKTWQWIYRGSGTVCEGICP